MSQPVSDSPSAVTAIDDQMLLHQGSQPLSILPSRQPSASALSATSGRRGGSTGGGDGNSFHGSELLTRSRSGSQALGDEDQSYPSPSTSRPSRFSLKDLLSLPKRSRRGSASSRKSVSSKRSDSGGNTGSTTTGESDFLKKYGVCGKFAIGKGATSVIRLAHKWDRAEGKVYAVKVLPPHLPNPSARPPRLSH